MISVTSFVDYPYGCTSLTSKRKGERKYSDKCAPRILNVDLVHNLPIDV